MNANQEVVTLKQLLLSLGACSDAVEWVGDRDLGTAWAECQRGDWMLWLADHLTVDHKMRVRCALGCARMVEDNAKEYPEVKACLDTVERWLNGHATQKELESAASAAWGAASAAWSAASAASAAWGAALSAASAASAESAAWSAASAASAAWGAASAARSAAWGAASAAWSEKQSDMIRSTIPLAELQRCITERAEGVRKVINLSQTAKAKNWHLASTIDALVEQGLDRKDANAFASFVVADHARIRNIRPEDHLTDAQYSRLSCDMAMVEDQDWLVL